MFNYQHVVGCVAWLTDYDILDALAKMDAVSIIVQKEDGLRPDGKTTMKVLRPKYETFPGTERYVYAGLRCKLSVCGCPWIEAVRCVGNSNEDASPRSRVCTTSALSLLMDRLNNWMMVHLISILI